MHLRVHTAYSLAEGALKLKQLPELCRDMGMPALAITDTHNLFGALEFAVICAKQGIQPIIGCQVYMTRHDCHGQKNAVPDQIVVLCQNEVGYKNLLRLISDSYIHLDPPHVPQVAFDDLVRYNAGLICLLGGKDSPLYRTLLDKDRPAADAIVHAYHTAFSDRLYIELQRHFDTDTDPSENEDARVTERRVNDELIRIALNQHIALTATNNVFFKDASMYGAHDALLCIAQGRYVSEQGRRKVTPHHYFKSAQAMQSLFEDVPEALSTPAVIAKRCHFMPMPHDPILPSFPTRAGRSEVDELREQAYAGLKKRLQHMTEIPQNYIDRLNYELGIIERMGFPGYFLIVADFIQFAKSHNIPVGPGRGSGAGSLVAWVLTITDMDPIRFGLIFERFLNPERISMPDFDVDFCQDRRDEVIEYVRKKYGHDHVAHIITFGKLQARAVIRDVGRVLQMPYGQVDKISKLIPNNPANPVTLQQALEIEPALKDAENSDESVRDLIRIGIQLEGLYRHASKHAAGVVIGDRPLYELVPLYVDEPGSVPATQFSMKYVEMAGLVKFDFLGLKTLTVIDKCCALILADEGLTLNAQDIPLDDAKTFESLQRVETTGVFQLESSGMREVVRKMRPDRFEDLIALVALFRPGPMDDIPRYVACKHGEEEVTYLHPMLEDILKDTYGVMVYQEQVMHIAQKLGGYSLGAADLLRRAMGKKIREEMDAQRLIFTEGAVAQGIKHAIASQIFDQMAKFAGYGFNKSHSAPYALLAYQTAYFKANYTAAFYAASMTLDMHNTDKLNVFRSDMIDLGIPILPPDINHSYADFRVEYDPHTQKKGVRYALAALKNVGEAAMKALTQERAQNGPYRNFEHFIDRLPAGVLNKRQLEHLIAAGCFDTLNTDRAQLWHQVDRALKHAHAANDDRLSQQQSLFGATSTAKFKLDPIKPPLKPWGILTKLQHEFEALSFFFSSHPLSIYSNLRRFGATPSCDISRFSDGASLKLVGVLITKTERTSKNGHKYAFVQLSDEHGVFEVALFSETYAKARDILIPGKPLFVSATLRQDGESSRLLANSMSNLEDIMEHATRSLNIFVKEALDIKSLEETLSMYEGGATVIKLITQIEGVTPLEIELPQRYSITSEARSNILALSGVVKLEDG